VRTKGHIAAARNYYSSTRDELDFQYLEDIYGMQNPIDLGFTNIIKPRVDALVGLSLLSEPDFRVAYTDADTIKAFEEKLEGVLSELKPKWVGYDRIAITLLITRTALNLQRTRHLLKEPRTG
jgi:hypothetical protein